jgi:hypothetical protein
VIFEDNEHQVPTETDGWFVFAARQDDYDPTISQAWSKPMRWPGDT